MAKFSDARVREIIAGPRAFRTYDFPGAEGVRIAFRVLTELEIDETRMAAQHEVRAYAKARGWEPQVMVDIDPDLMQRTVERHVIFRAAYDADTIESADPARFFATPDDVKQLDSVTATKLGELYLEHQEWVSPLKQLSDEELKELIDKLGKARAPEHFLGVFAPSMLRRCVISLASRARSAT
jgi:hypothetical protein